LPLSLSSSLPEEPHNGARASRRRNAIATRPMCTANVDTSRSVLGPRPPARTDALQDELREETGEQPRGDMASV